MSELILLFIMAAHFFFLHLFIRKYLQRIQRSTASEIISTAREKAMNTALREAAMYKYFTVFFVIVLLICFPEFGENGFIIEIDFLMNISKLISLSIITIMVRLRFLKIKFSSL